MAIKDYSLPFQDLTSYVPKNLRNPMITSLIDNLFNRFLTADEAVPLYGYVGRKPASPDDRTPKVPQATVERDVNALIPVMSFKVGTETYSFTPQDLIRKAEVLGVSTDQSSWLYSQGNNYSPPITFDKFTNFFNYYWIANALPNTPSMAWNPTNAPEYYTIAAPLLTDLDKPNVRAASVPSDLPFVPTGTGLYAQTWVITFISSTQFTVQATGPLVGFGVGEDLQGPFTLPVPPVVPFPGPWPTHTQSFSFSIASRGTILSFNIVRDIVLDGVGFPLGYEDFAAGDTFSITAPFISSTYAVTPVSVGPGVKGKFQAVNSLDTYQTIGGVVLQENDRVLIKDGTNTAQGIYIVKPGTWVRASDFDTTTAAVGARVWVREGANANTMWVSYATFPGWGWAQDVAATVSNTTDWQETNFWAKGTDLVTLGVDLAKVIQATRPIIEYTASTQLNRYVGADGLPSDGADPTATFYEQVKSEFNQAPLFDLYRYDGHHARQVSSIFFYAEDPTAQIDVALQRRVKHSTNTSSDFLFNHGLLEGENTLLFYKANSSLKTIWHPGYSQATVVDQEYGGTGNGTLVVTPGSDPFSAQQIWTLTANDSTTFSIGGSKTKVIPAPYDVITVGVPYSNGLFNCTITAGGTPFASGDTFTFRLGNFETTRYVYRDGNAALYDLFGGEPADTNKVGAWQVPRMFFNNVAADNGEEVPEGTLYSHFRGVLANQLDSTPEDRAFGGSIKLWSEQQNLLAALLMQRDITPSSMIDLAQREYEAALNSLVDAYVRELMQYVSKVEVLVSPSDTSQLLDFLLTQRVKDYEVRSVLYDTTSPVAGFPSTLPQLGVAPLVAPSRYFDNELGVTLLRHHDGHASPLYVNSQDFLDRLYSPGLLIKRSDNSLTPVIGSLTGVPPALPYKGQLWAQPGAQIKIFNVISDEFSSPASAEVGQFWFNRGSNVLSVWDGALWVNEPNPLAPWVTFDPAGILNDLILTVEQRLFVGINPHHRSYFNTSAVDNALDGPLSQQLEHELAAWSAVNGYDQTAPDYVSGDAFTWNYSSLGITQTASLSSPTVPARWYRLLRAHQSSVPGVVPTARPNLEPWKLVGNTVKPLGWDALWAAPVTPSDVAAGGFITGVTANAVLYSPAPLITVLAGLPVIDGVVLAAGQTVLLVSELSQANNGLWVVASGGWARSTAPLVQNLVVTVTDGLLYSSTNWWLSQTVTTLNVDPAPFEQVRGWKTAMWTMIQLARPSLKLSIDTRREALLPPYVNSVFPWSVNAITTTLPPNPSKAYLFGEGSPVETVWQKSIEYRYSLARALFRKDPLSFLGNCWGFEWVEIDDILYDGFDLAVPGHPRFRLHGDPIAPTTRAPLTLASVTGPGADLVIVHDGYTATRKQSFTIKTAGGLIIGHADEGVTTTITGAGYTLTGLRLEDEGKPFRVGDYFHIVADGTGPFTATLNQATYARFLGFGQTFTNALRASSIDTSQGYALKAYRGWDVNLGYRAGGLVATDDLRLFDDGEAIPASAYDLRFKRSSYAKDLWVQGLRVTVVQIGASKLDKYGNVIASSDASDWTFRIEGYNSRHLDVSYYTYNTASSQVSFYALNKEHTDLPWYQPTLITGTVNTVLPITVVGLQAVVDVLFGYSQYVYDQGWRFNDDGIQNIDLATGRVRSWQLEIEKLIDRVYTGIALGEGHVCNPFMDRVWLTHDIGLMSRFFDTALFDVTGHPGVFDTLGVKIDTDALTILRGREKSMISANVPMFSAHAQLNEYEHLFVFSNLSSPSTNSGLLYDPFSGARIATVKLNGRRQAAQTLRPEFGGHYLVGDEVKQNLKASTDKVARYYDTDHVYEDELSTRHALALLGFSLKEYMSNLDLNERTQFNFWRGLIQMKGTNASIDAFLNNDRFEDAKIDEYWAYKVAEYGDSRSKIFPELKLSVNDTVQQFTKLIFDPSSVTGYETFTIVQADDESRWFSIDDLDGETSFEAQVAGTYSRALVLAGDVITLPFVADKLVTTGTAVVTQLNGTTIKVTTGGTLVVTGYGPATPKFNPVKLFNYVSAELIEEIPEWHPAIGQHTPAALESVNVISELDPARYNFSTLVSGNANYDPLRTWGAKEVGRVWWDTTNLSYLPYSDQVIFNAIDERLSRWGTLADFATVDVVEWVESAVPPSEYDAQAALDAGDADLNPYTKADGTVYGAKTYARERAWYVRPIAWSRAGVPLEAAHPALLGATGGVLQFTTPGLAVLTEGLFSDHGIVTGMRLGAWQQDANATRPLSEYLITGAITKNLIGAAFPLASAYGGLTADVSLAVTAWTDKVGPLVFSAASPPVATQLRDANGLLVEQYDVATYLRVTEDDSGESQVIQIRNDRGINGGSDAVAAARAYQVAQFGSVKFGDDPTGLVPATTYNFTVTLDGTPFVVSVLGSNATTFSALVSQINTQLAGAPFELIDGDLYAFATTSVSIVDGGSSLFGSLYDFNQFLTPVAGVAAAPAVPAPANFGATFTTAVGDQFVYDLSDFGLRLTVKATSAGTYDTAVLLSLITGTLNSLITMRDAAPIELIAVLSDPDNLVFDPSEFSNDPLNVTNNGVGWRAWSVPTQAQLDADSRVPNSEYFPYVGEFDAPSQVSVAVVKDAADGGGTYTLNDGTVINKYQTAWEDWTELQNTVLNSVAETTGNVAFTLATGITLDRVSVYVNGVAQLAGTYTLVGSVLTVLTVTQGHAVTVIVRAYSPSAEELSFDPAVKENLLIQRQYKSDYQYVSVPQRDSDGSISTTKYYFWVQGRSTAARGKNLSVKAITELLTEGPSQYLTFQHLIGAGTVGDEYRYDAITISGLSYVVTKDDTFKLRFTRNFTLRDDPEGLDLKDTHVEWTLIRPGQRTKIPEQLWNTMVNTACAQDTAGNQLPSPARASYDERNGTRTQFGFGQDQVLAPTDLVLSTLLFTVLNTKLVDDSGATPVPDYMTFLDFNQSDTWFSTASNARNTLTKIWNQAKVQQINELFFAVLEDICAAQYELTDIFKTSRLSAYSIKVVTSAPVVPTYE
jgi:hypothetical protein